MSNQTLLSSITRLLNVLIEIIGEQNNPRLCRSISIRSDFYSKLKNTLSAASFVISGDKANMINITIDLVLNSLIYLNVDMICQKLTTIRISSKDFIMRKIVGDSKIGSVSLSQFDPIFEAIDYIALHPNITIGAYLKRVTKIDNGIDL